MTPVFVIQSALKEKLKDGRNTVLLLHVYYFTEVFCQLNSAVEKVLCNTHLFPSPFSPPPCLCVLVLHRG